uniref:Transmembrane protein n=1 Tax=Acrobeloides nanus TaxID=290746 RepID=A0A914CAF3_9BILA
MFSSGVPFILILVSFNFDKCIGQYETCIINASLPPYQPNIYVCNGTGYVCCRVYGQNACCATDLSAGEFMKQAIFPICFFGFFLLLLFIAYCYFNDVDPIISGDGENFSDKPTLTTYLFPDAENYQVEDPILALPTNEKTPSFADPWENEGDENSQQEMRQRKKN